MTTPQAAASLPIRVAILKRWMHASLLLVVPLVGRCFDDALRMWVASASQHPADGDTIISTEG